ncbi:MAG: type VI secretion system protein ImpL, partial [Deltaproteobacteria bacterium]|nr:type VI secretion system protein ImpL [Deltaproteobacteria bacterium]
MKQIFFKILKVFFIIAVILLTILLVFGIVLSLDWAWWVGFFILLGILGLGLGLLFLRKLWLKRREQHFVDQIIEQDDSYLKTVDDKESARLRELQDSWKEAIESLKSSHLKKYGNPLYVLPWYMVIGESGSGKTTAIKSAGLSSPFADVSRTSGISGTKNC